MSDEIPRNHSADSGRVLVGRGSWALFHAPLRVTRWTAGVAAEPYTGQPGRDGHSDDGNGGDDVGANAEEYAPAHDSTDANHPDVRPRGGGDGLSAGDINTNEYAVSNTNSGAGTGSVRDSAIERNAARTVHGRYFCFEGECQ